MQRIQTAMSHRCKPGPNEECETCDRFACCMDTRLNFKLHRSAYSTARRQSLSCDMKGVVVKLGLYRAQARRGMT